jgi:uncharacterized membrane protein YfcA
MTFDAPLAIAGLLVGIIVGLTGMGGGALMTPMLVFVFNVNPLTAISSDIVVSLLMKPAGAAVHLRHGTVELRLVGWLCLGSMPAAFAGAWFVSTLPAELDLDGVLKSILGVALLTATAGLVVRAVLQMWRNRLPLGEGPARPTRPPRLVVRPLPTFVLGAVAGFMVGMTSVGAGSVIIVVLLLMYPALKASQLVGTDLAQAVPLVAAAAAGHLLFGDFSLTVASSLLIGAIPGAWLGAQASSRAPGGIIRRILAILLFATGLKLIGVPTEIVVVATAAAFLAVTLAFVVIRDHLSRRAMTNGTRPPAVGSPTPRRAEEPGPRPAEHPLPRLPEAPLPDLETPA